MSFIDTFEQMLVLFFIVIIGFIALRFKVVDPEFTKHFSSLIIKITAPCLILSTAMGKELPNRDAIIPILVWGTISMVIMIVLAYPITRFILRAKKDDYGIFQFALVFGNTAFIGFPVVGALFGQEAIFYANILAIPFNILVFSLGVIYITAGHESFKLNYKVFVSPCLLATYASIIMVALEVTTPDIIANTCIYVGNITIPGALLIIGASLATVPLKEMLGSRQIYLICLFKLLIVPFIIYQLFLLSPLDILYAQILTVLSAMPVASYGTMLCLTHGKDGFKMAQATFLTTFLAVFSIPILALML